jgi:hypothetical protein
MNQLYCITHAYIAGDMTAQQAKDAAMASGADPDSIASTLSMIEYAERLLVLLGKFEKHALKDLKQ